MNIEDFCAYWTDLRIVIVALDRMISLFISDLPEAKFELLRRVGAEVLG